jgi:putative ABC transport system permease protein
MGVHDDRVVAGVATAGPPRPQPPTVLSSAAQSFNLTAMAGVLIGFLIAVNTILLAFENRRPILGTVAAIGARPSGLLGGLLAEGALVGAAGGLVAVPPGYFLGSYLVDKFGRSMLAGSGGTLAARLTPDLIVIAILAGVLCGVLAMVGPAARLVREGPLISMASFGGVQRIRTISWWPLGVGMALLIGSVVVLTEFGRGELALDAGSNGMTAGLLGVAFATVSIAPRAAAVLIRGLTAARPDIGRMLGADVRRYNVLFAISAAVLALGANLAIGSQSMQMLATRQVAAQKAELLPNSLVISPQSILDQSNGHISQVTYDRIKAVAGGRPVAARWRSAISTGPSTRLVIGVTPGDWYSTATYRPDDDPETTWRGLRGGEVALSQVTATRMHATVGELVALPTVSGVKNFRVAGLFGPRVISDSAVGDIVLTSAEVARVDWAAVRDQVAIKYQTPAEASAHRPGFLQLGGLSVYDDKHWSTAATTGVNRFFEPFTATGYVVMAAAGLGVLNVFVLGLVQRRRERAVLRAIGVTQRQEQAVVLAHGGLLALLVAVAGGLGGIGLTYLQSLGSPVNYGITIAWGLSVSPLVSGIAALVAMIAAATVYPVIHTTRLEIAAQLRTTA